MDVISMGWDNVLPVLGCFESIVHRLVKPTRGESRMRTSLAFTALTALAITACSISTTPNSFTIKSQTKYTGSNAVTKTATTSYTAGSKITIDNANGDVSVTGVAGLDKITVTTNVFAFADIEADGNAAIADVTSTIAIQESQGAFTIKCGKAQSAHASAGTSTTGCEGFAVQVPAGTAAEPLNLSATAENGEITGTALIGSVTIHSENGAATASIGAAPGAVIEVSSANGDVSLALPQDFATDAITLAPGSPGKVNNTAFPDVTDANSAHRKTGGAKSITVKTDLGDVTLKSQ
jgi:hypothetical protein